MDDLISRNALMERLSKKSSGIANARYTEGWNDCILMVRSMVHGATEVDAAPVVRCRDCKHWDDDPDTYGKSDGPKGKCMKSFELMLFDDFCSYGKRR